MYDLCLIFESNVDFFIQSDEAKKIKMLPALDFNGAL